MKKILNIYKPQSMTPVQLIQQVKQNNSELQKIKIGFAGRLDPLAHGVMLLMVGEENKQREKYLGLEKEYEFKVWFGVESDSYDYLGLLRDLEYKIPPKDLEQHIQQFARKYTGELILPYPPFSSKTVNGVQLYKLAKKNQLAETKLPERKVTITNFEVLGFENRSSLELEKEILANLRKIKGFFRQKKTIDLWKQFFKQNGDQTFILASFRLQCSSGTYVRTLASLMGKKLGCGAIAYEILRTKVGSYRLEDSSPVSF